MDSYNKSDKKSMKDGVRRVRCPRCRNLLVEPTDFPLYQCGYCSTTLQAKYYKGPPVNADGSLVPSETLTSRTNSVDSGSEVNAPTEKIELVFPSKQDFTDEHTVETSNDKDEASGHGAIHSDLNSDKSFEIQEISKHEEGLMGRISNDHTENSLMMGHVDGHSSLLASDSESPAVFGGDSLQVKLDGSCEVDGLMQKSQSTFLNDLLPSDFNMLYNNSSKDDASEPDKKPSHFNSVPCHHQSIEIESEENEIQALNFGEQMKSSIMIGSTESQRKCSSTVSSSGSPAVSGKDFTLLDDGTGVDSSVQKSEFVPLGDQKSFKREIGDILSLNGETLEINSNISHFISPDSGLAVDDLEHKREFVALEVEKSFEGETQDILSLKDKITGMNYSTSHFTSLDDGPGAEDSEQKSELMIFKEQKLSKENTGDILSLADRISELNSSTPHFILLDSGPAVVDLEQKNELVHIKEQTPKGEMEDIPLKDKISELNSPHLNSENSHDKRTATDSQEDSTQATITCKEAETSPIQENIEIERECLPSASSNSSPTVSEYISHTANVPESTTAVDDVLAVCESVQILDPQNLAGTNTKEMFSGNEELQHPTSHPHYHSYQYVHSENQLYKNQANEVEVIHLSEEVEKKLNFEVNELNNTSLSHQTSYAELGSVTPQLKTSHKYYEVDGLRGNVEVTDNLQAVSLKGDFQECGSGPYLEPQCQERENFESLTNKESMNIGSDMQITSNTSHGIVVLEDSRSSDVKEEHIQSSYNENVVDVLEVELQSTQGQSASHFSRPSKSRNNSSPSKSDDGCKVVDLKNIEDTYVLKKISLKGDACESSSSPQSPEKQYQEREETWKNTEVKDKSSGLNMQVMSNTNRGIDDLDNARSRNIEVEHIISGENGGRSRAYADNKPLPIHARHKQGENVSSAAGRRDSPSQLLHLPRRSVRYQNSLGSFHSMTRDEVRSREANGPHERITERKVSQGRHGLEATRNVALNQNEPSSRSLVGGSFQRKSSGLKEDYHFVQNWIESERAELLRSLSRCSDSTEFDRERMEILNRIDELRQLVGSGNLNRESSMSYQEGRSLHSQSSFSESEYEYSQYSPSFSRHQHAVRSLVTEENQLVERTQSPRSRLHDLRYSPQQFPHPTPCPHSSCRRCCDICSQNLNNDGLQCNFHSRATLRNKPQFERVQKREREYDVKRYCRPILGAAQFVSCYECFHIIQIPEHFDFLASRYKQLRCGFCREILEFSVLGNTQIVPYPRETRESYREGDRVSSLEGENSRSLDMIYSSPNHEHTSHVPRNRNMAAGRIEKKQPPLHTLMGYVSARDIIFQEDD